MQPPPVITRTAPKMFWWLGGGLVLLTALVVLFRFNPSRYNFYPRCTLYVTTGIYCPGCGSQRALYHLVHGELATALRCNALLVLSLPFAAFFCARYAMRWAANKPLPPFIVRPAWIILISVVVVLFTILRNIHCFPFTNLAPP